MLKVFLLVAFPLIFVSCEKQVVLDLSDSEGQYLVVEGNIDDSSPGQWIRLSYSGSYYDPSPGIAVRGAEIVVSGGEVEYLFTESKVDTLKGYYFNYNIGRELIYGVYELRIEHQDETYYAKSVYRPVPEIDSVTIKLNLFSSLGLTDETLYDVFVHFSELPGPGDHYLVDLEMDGNLKTPRPSQKTVISDENLREYVSLAVHTISEEDMDDNDGIALIMRSISRSAYEFYLAFFFQTDLSGNPFAGAPPANIPTNMSRGALGFFQVSAASSEWLGFDTINR